MHAPDGEGRQHDDGVASATEGFDLARAGAVAFLVKPFGLHELERCLLDACRARARLSGAGEAGPVALSPLAEQALQELVRRYRFTPRQAEVVRRTAQGTRRADLPKALGISEASCKTLVRRVLLPATLPAYVTGLRGGLGLGWMFVVAAEFMGASEGLGFLLIDGQMTGRPAVIIGSIILFAVLGKLTDLALASLGQRFLSWQDVVSNAPDQRRLQAV